MQQVTAVKNKHIFLLEVNATLSPGEVEALADKFSKTVDGLNVVMVQPQTVVTLIHIEDEKPA